jgi:hypothetical protein
LWAIHFSAFFREQTGNCGMSRSRVGNGFVSAAQIIEQIKALPTLERLEVASFARAFKPDRMLTGEELAVIAQRLADASDPAEIETLKDALRWGWYGPAGSDADA